VMGQVQTAKQASLAHCRHSSTLMCETKLVLRDELTARGAQQTRSAWESAFCAALTSAMNLPMHSGVRLQSLLSWRDPAVQVKHRFVCPHSPKTSI